MLDGPIGIVNWLAFSLLVALVSVASSLKLQYPLISLRYEISEAPDGKFGTMDENEEWNGMIKELIEKVGLPISSYLFDVECTSRSSSY